MDLQDSIALVTGGSHGIGIDVLRALAGEGVRVAINVHDSERGLDLVESLGRDKAIAVHADISRRGHVREMVQQVEDAFGGLDILVNSAGVGVRCGFLDIREEDWERVIAVNLHGTFHCCQEALPLMLAGNGGKIINISSVGGIEPIAASAHYGSAEAGVRMLTRYLAREFAPDIQVNDIACGPIETERHGSTGRDECASATECAPLEEGVCGAVLMLCRCDYITGQTIVVDGGLTMR